MESKWLFPSEVQELEDLVAEGQILIHGGGTGIPRNRVRSVRTVVDLSRIGWDRCVRDGEFIRIGAMCTFNQVVRELGELRPGHILTKSLNAAASTALRNRITVGGSVTFFPVWSDLMGPLLALGASVDLVGTCGGVYPLEDFVSNRGRFKKTVIRSVLIPDEEWLSWYYREVRVGFDYPGCTITLLLRKNGRVVEDFRGVVVGTKNRFMILDQIAQLVKDCPCGDVVVAGLGDELDLAFPDKKSGSSEYFRQVTAVWIERGLAELLER